MLVFRPNVCAVVTDTECRRVLLFRRVDELIEQRWQFPQGGLLEGEVPEQGIRRELQEEIGANKIEILQQLPYKLRYVYPPEVKQRLRQTGIEKYSYDGQEQTWFLVRLPNNEKDISLVQHPKPEFDSWRWSVPQQAIAEVVPFKRDVYRHALAEFFGPLLSIS